MKRMKTILICAISIMLIGSMTGCTSDTTDHNVNSATGGTLEDTDGDGVVDDVIDDVKDGVDNLADDLMEGTEEVGDDIKDEADEVIDDMKDGTAVEDTMIE